MNSLSTFPSCRRCIVVATTQNRCQEAPKSTPGDSKIDTRRCLNRAKIAQGGQGASQERRRSAQERTKSVQERPRAHQERPKSLPRAPKSDPRATQERPRTPQETLKSAQRRPRAPLGAFGVRKTLLSKAIRCTTRSRSWFGTIFGRSSRRARKHGHAKNL